MSKKKHTKKSYADLAAAIKHKYKDYALDDMAMKAMNKELAELAAKQEMHKKLLGSTDTVELGWGGAASGGLQGLGTGAQIGTMIAPGIGTAIGAGVGLIGGAISGHLSEKKEEERYEDYVTQQERALAQQEFLNKPVNRATSGMYAGPMPGFKYGGSLKQYRYGGPSHENNPLGGVPVDENGNLASLTGKEASASVEGGEVVDSNYVFSNSLSPDDIKKGQVMSKRGTLKEMRAPTPGGEPLGYLPEKKYLKDGGSIEIAPEKRGTFKAQATKMGMSVQEAASKILNAPEGKYSPAMRRKANFAKNFAKENGGEIEKFTDKEVQEFVSGKRKFDPDTDLGRIRTLSDFNSIVKSLIKEDGTYYTPQEQQEFMEPLVREWAISNIEASPGKIPNIILGKDIAGDILFGQEGFVEDTRKKVDPLETTKETAEVPDLGYIPFEKDGKFYEVQLSRDGTLSEPLPITQFTYKKGLSSKLPTAKLLLEEATPENIDTLKGYGVDIDKLMVKKKCGGKLKKLQQGGFPMILGSEGLPMQEGVPIGMEGIPATTSMQGSTGGFGNFITGNQGSLSGLSSLAIAAGQNIRDIQSARALPVKYARVTPSTVDYSAQRSYIQREADMAKAQARADAANTSRSRGELMSRLQGAEMGISRATGSAIGQSLQQEQNINAQLLSQAQAQNAQIQMREAIDREREYTAAEEQRRQARQNLATQTRGFISDQQKAAAQEKTMGAIGLGTPNVQMLNYGGQDVYGMQVAPDTFKVNTVDGIKYMDNQGNIIDEWVAKERIDAQMAGGMQ